MSCVSFFKKQTNNVLIMIVKTHDETDVEFRGEAASR